MIVYRINKSLFFCTVFDIHIQWPIKVMTLGVADQPDQGLQPAGCPEKKRNLTTFKKQGNWYFSKTEQIGIDVVDLGGQS